MSGEMTQKQFDVVAELLRSKEPAKTAAKMVLVKGKSNQDAIAKTGLSPQSVSNALTRYRAAHRKLLLAYAKTA